MASVRARMPWIGVAVVVASALVWSLRPVPLDVEVAPVTRGGLRETLEEDGRTRVRHHVMVAAPVSGRVAESRLQAGDSVGAGDVLAMLHPAPLDARTRAEAQAMLAQAASLAREAGSQLQQVRVQLEEARRDLARAERLAAAGAVAERERDAALTAVRVREQEVEAAGARVSAAREGERVARAVLLGADPARAGSAPVRITAPIAGRVLRMFETHDRVVAAGTPLVEVGDPTSLEVVCDVLSRDATRISTGMPMEVRVADRAPMEAVVARVEPVAFTRQSALGVEEQRVNVIGRMAGPVQGLGDGFEVDVSVVLWQGTDVVRAPSAALVPLDSGWGVFVVEQGRARRRAVTVGRRGAHEVEVTSGVEEGTMLVLRPDERLHDGTRVRAAR